MLVYGIRCSPADLAGLTPSDAHADYYLDYGLLVFPKYTRPLCLNSHGYLKKSFWDRVQRVIENPQLPHEFAAEQPYITDEENEVLRELRDSYPTIQTAWYHVPRVVWKPEEELPSLSVSELTA